MSDSHQIPSNQRPYNANIRPLGKFHHRSHSYNSTTSYNATNLQPSPTKYPNDNGNLTRNGSSYDHGSPYNGSPYRHGSPRDNHENNNPFTNASNPRSSSYITAGTQQDWQKLIPPLPSNSNEFNFNMNNDIMNNDHPKSHPNNNDVYDKSSRHSIHSPTQFNFQPSTFHVNNDLPTYVQNQLTNPPRFKKANSDFSTSNQLNNPILPSHQQQNTSSLPPNQSTITQPVSSQSQLQSSRQLQPARSTNQSHQVPSSRQLLGVNSGHTQGPALEQTSGNQVGNDQLQENRRKKSLRKRTKVCRKCGKDITGQFVRALNSSFHVECFCCNECGKQCSSKFFPYEIIDKQTNIKYQVALCEYDYFKKLNLICFNCNSALRGPYITALGNKYHLEHFKCNICQKVFESDESYYEHDSNIYCHFHYLKKFANHCEGCNSSIVKQFVELFRGGRNQQWHPECYMVNKFWNVTITQDVIGNKQLIKILNQNDNNVEFLQENDLLYLEQLIENLVIKIWISLSNFEELTASSISDMLLNACIGNQFNGLLSTGKLILYVEILFNAIDLLIPLYDDLFKNKLIHVDRKESEMQTSDDNNQQDQPIKDVHDKLQFENESNFLKKEPRNICGKIMSYLAILRKSNQINLNGPGSLSSDLLSVITGCAHYLKLLIRIGLQNSLKLNRLRGDSIAIDTFLSLVKNFEKISNINNLEIINNYLIIPLNSTDLCKICNKSIEKSCIKFDNDKCHIKCFKCSNCLEPINVNDGKITINDDEINKLCELYCNNCHSQDEVTVKAEKVSDLQQLIYLLKIAYLRSRQVMLNNSNVNSSINQKSNKNRNSTILEDKQKLNYSNTIKDITSLRTKRENQNLSNSIKKDARKSIIFDPPQAENAEIDKDTTINSNDLSNTSIDDLHRNNSVNSQNSFILSQDDNDHFINKKLNIKDEPPTKRVLSNNQYQLNRTSDLLKNEKSLTLDDIPRIVAAEQARDQRPNAFKHHNSLYQRLATKSLDLKQLQLSPSAIHGMNLNESNNNGTPKLGANVGNNSNNLKSNMNNPGYNFDSNDNLNTSPLSFVNNGNDRLSRLSKSSIMNSPNLDKRVRYYSELDKSEHFILRHIAVEALNQLLNNKYNKLELLSLIQTKKSPTFWDKFKFGSGNNNDSHKNVNGVFGVNLQDLTKQYGIDSDLGVGPSKLRIPIVIDDLINSLKTKDMSVEGIFRLNGNIKKLKELTTQINSNPLKSPDFSNQSAVQLAALMKKWLRDLPNPLLTFNLYALWIESQKQKDLVMRKRLMKLIYCMLPRSHRNLVEVLLSFFSWASSFAEIDEENGSKMDIHNIATVISPNILYNKNNESENNTNASDMSGGVAAINSYGESYFLAIEVVNQLIEMHEDLTIIPEDLLEFFDKCSFEKDNNDLINSTTNISSNKEKDKSKDKDKDPTTKEIMNKIEKFSKENPNFFLSYDIKDENSDPLNHEVRSNTVLRGLSKASAEHHGETGNV